MQVAEDVGAREADWRGVHASSAPALYVYHASPPPTPPSPFNVGGGLFLMSEVTCVVGQVAEADGEREADRRGLHTSPAPVHLTSYALYNLAHICHT